MRSAVVIIPPEALFSGKCEHHRRIAGAKSRLFVRFQLVDWPFISSHSWYYTAGDWFRKDLGRRGGSPAHAASLHVCRRRHFCETCRCNFLHFSSSNPPVPHLPAQIGNLTCKCFAGLRSGQRNHCRPERCRRSSKHCFHLSALYGSD
jgi:hypothetical protein